MKIPCRLPVRQFRTCLFHKKKRCLPVCLTVSLTSLAVYLLALWLENVVQVRFFLFGEVKRNDHAEGAALARGEPFLERASEDDFSDEDYERMIREDEKRIVRGLGDNGEPVQLQGKEAKRGKADMKRQAYNIELSKKIALNRTLPDFRHPKCREMKYPRDLPTASVIIVFTDESLSTLLRTIYSVLIRSPPRYLKEIILVDDYSVSNELKGKLDYYVKSRLSKYVKLFRLPSRQGLIRARLKGAKEATGEVLVFLDAHCEATNGWLPPMLARIYEDRRNVVVPIIDPIEPETFEYRSAGDRFDFPFGSFNWDGYFSFIDIPEEEMSRVKDLASPMRTATMAGGLFAIDRSYFYEIGSYDEKMDLWGGENLEMSFRVWQCGGRLETIPCSRIGHMSRDFHAWAQKDKRDSHGINTARMVKVWWDDYARLFFDYSRPDLKNVDVGDLTERIELRKKLKCRPFSWFLQKVHPTKFIPDENVKAYGKVKSEVGVCVDSNGEEDDTVPKDLGIYPCYEEMSRTQFWSLSLQDELRNEHLCAEVRNEETVPLLVRLKECDGSNYQKWHFTKEGFLIHQETQLCLDSKRRTSGWTTAEVNKCRRNRKTQVWTWQNLIEEPLHDRIYLIKKLNAEYYLR